MRARYHVVVSTGLAAGMQVTMHSWSASAACFFSGILIDVDHYLEYYIFRRKFPWRYSDLVDFCLDFKENKAYLLFHAYEYLFIFWFLIYVCHLGVFWMGMALGLTVHLILDQFTNPIQPLFYFLTFRILNGFEVSKLLVQKNLQ